MLNVGLLVIAAASAAASPHHHVLGVYMGMPADDFRGMYPGAECPPPFGVGQRVLCTVWNPDPTVSKMYVEYSEEWGRRVVGLSATFSEDLLRSDVLPTLTKRFGKPREDRGAGRNQYGDPCTKWEWSLSGARIGYVDRLFMRKWYATSIEMESPEFKRWARRQSDQEDAAKSRARVKGSRL